MQSNSTGKSYDNKAGYKSDTKVDDAIQTGKAKKEDPVKQGLEELQRILPHLGSPGEGKVWFSISTFSNVFLKRLYTG